MIIHSFQEFVNILYKNITKIHDLYIFRLFCKCWGLANQQVFLAPNTIVFDVVLFAQQ